MSLSIQVLHRGAFHAIPGATAQQVASNAWEIHVPATDPIHRKTRRTLTAEAWDEAIFLLGDVESQAAVGCAEDHNGVTVSVIIL
jgi:hypothetical protein